MATIQLSDLLMSERRRFQTSTGQQGWRQTHQDRIPVLKPQQYGTFTFKPFPCMKGALQTVEAVLTLAFFFFNHFSTSSVSPTEKVAELSFVATLEDLGFLKTREVIVSESFQVRRACLHRKGWTTLPVTSVVLYSSVLVFTFPFMYFVVRMNLQASHSYHPTQQHTGLPLPQWLPSPQIYNETPWSTVQLWSWSSGRKSRKICLTMR